MTNDSDLVQLIYVSTAVSEMDTAALDRILESSVELNRKNAVTGMLLYSRGSFMQVLEGPESAVDETYGRICRDPRHQDLYLLSKLPVAKRDFSGWSMGFRRLAETDATAHPAFSPFFSNGFSASQLAVERSIALNILRQFSAEPPRY